ncbi:hypothetical protein ACNFRX_14530, partial [Streptomyces griseoaurantiacus]
WGGAERPFVSGSFGVAGRQGLSGSEWGRPVPPLLFPFSERPLPAALLAELAEAAQAEGARLHLPDQRATDRVLRSTWEAESRNRSDSGRAAESRRWADGPRSSPGFGPGPAAAGPQDALDRLPVRDFGAHRRPSALSALPYETRPALVLLRTAHDRRADWLLPGRRWSGCCWWRPRAGCARRCCTRRWSGRTCAETSTGCRTGTTGDTHRW